MYVSKVQLIRLPSDCDLVTLECACESIVAKKDRWLNLEALQEHLV